MKNSSAAANEQAKTVFVEKLQELATQNEKAYARALEKSRKDRSKLKLEKL